MRVFVGLLVVGAALAAVPLLGLPLFYESFLYLVFHWVILATSWNILSGYTGYFSFGHGAFFGAGMYTTAALASRFDIPFLWTLPAAALVALLLGTALGAVVFRARQVRGELFALVTLAVTFVVGTIVLNTPIDGGPGVYLSAVPVPKIGPSATSSFYLMALAVALATMAIAYGVYRSRLGTGLFAIHDDEDVAEVLGVPTFRCKMAAFAVSCALAGVAGGIHALFVSYVTAGETFTITVPLTVVLMSVLGGTRHWAGPAVGAALITALLYAFTAGDHAVAGKAVFGAVLIAVILFMPRGVLGTLLARKPPKPAAPTPAAASAGTTAVGPDGATSTGEPAAPAREDTSPKHSTKTPRRHPRLQRPWGGAAPASCSRREASASHSAACARSTMSTSKSARGKSSGCSDPTARANRRSSTWSAAITNPTPVNCSLTDATSRASPHTESRAPGSRAPTRSRARSRT